MLAGPTGQLFAVRERLARWADAETGRATRSAGRYPGLGERLGLRRADHFKLGDAISLWGHDGAGVTALREGTGL